MQDSDIRCSPRFRIFHSEILTLASPLFPDLLPQVEAGIYVRITKREIAPQGQKVAKYCLSLGAILRFHLFSVLRCNHFFRVYGASQSYVLFFQSAILRPLRHKLRLNTTLGGGDSCTADESSTTPVVCHFNSQLDLPSLLMCRYLCL